MALSDITFANRRRSHRMRIVHPSFSSRPSQLERTNQTVSPTGASVAVRPPLTTLRRMDNSGAGTVGYA